MIRLPAVGWCGFLRRKFHRKIDLKGGRNGAMPVGSHQKRVLGASAHRRMETSDEKEKPMKTTREFTRPLAALLLTLFAVASARGQSGPDTFNPYLNGNVESLAVQADGKILIGGTFTLVANLYRTNVARLNPDGRPDTNFVPRIGMYGRRIIAQPDGRILVGGIFNPPGHPELARGLVRFETNGSVDASFNSPLRDMPFALALQTDGKVVAGFQTVPYIARYNADGSPDTGFHAQPDNVVYDLVMQADGKILAAGYFEKVEGQSHRLLARLNTDGSVDASFNVDVGHAGYNWGVVRRVAVQTDGKIVFGGGFTSVNGAPRQNLARVNANGTLDPQFNAGTDGEVHGVVAQTNGRIVVAGDFTMLNGQPRLRLGRLNWDGSLDATLTAGADRFIRATALQPDGRILLGGQFTTLGGASRTYVGRIAADVNPSPMFIDISSMRVLGGGAVQFSFLNPNAAGLSVLASEDVAAPLPTWVNLGAPVPVGGGVYQFTDPGAANLPRRFYRVGAP
jgi:uncharacterized delta-60 repeat protein